MSTVRLVSWNIRFGGRRKRPQIASALSACGADIVALGEWLPGPDTLGHRMDMALAEEGYVHQAIPASPPSGDFGAMLASRWPLTMISGGPPELDHRWAHASVETPDGPLRVIAVYVPTNGRDSGTAKRLFLQWLVDTTPALLKAGPVVITGDFNCDHADDTGQFSPRLVQNPLFDQLFRLGWVDLYRSLHAPGRAASWWSTGGRGFMLDHALAGPMGPNAVHAGFVNDDGDPTDTSVPVRRLSDHLRMVCDLDLH